MNRFFLKTSLFFIWLLVLCTFESCKNSKTNRSLPSSTYTRVYYSCHVIEDYNMLYSDNGFALIYHNDSIGNFHVCVGFSQKGDTLNYQNKTVFIETDSKLCSPTVVAYRNNIVFAEKKTDAGEYVVRDFDKASHRYKTTDMFVDQNISACVSSTENEELKKILTNISISTVILENLCLSNGNNWQNAIQILRHIHDLDRININTVDNTPHGASHLFQKLLRREKIMSQYMAYRKNDIK